MPLRKHPESEDRRQRTEDRRQRSEDRGQRSEDRREKKEDRGKIEKSREATPPNPPQGGTGREISWGLHFGTRRSLSRIIG